MTPHRLREGRFAPGVPWQPSSPARPSPGPDYRWSEAAGPAATPCMFGRRRPSEPSPRSELARRKAVFHPPRRFRRCGSRRWTLRRSTTPVFTPMLCIRCGVRVTGASFGSDAFGPAPGAASGLATPVVLSGGDGRAHSRCSWVTAGVTEIISGEPCRCDACQDGGRAGCLRDAHNSPPIKRSIPASAVCSSNSSRSRESSRSWTRCCASSAAARLPRPWA